MPVPRLRLIGTHRRHRRFSTKTPLWLKPLMPSTVIAQHHYDPATSTLTVTFVTGRRYAYAGVPADEYAALRRSFSKGGWFNRHIRDAYPATELDPVAPAPPRAEAPLHDRLAASIAHEGDDEPR